jgi:UDP-2,3-diacylglucosamine pyrophosphatase LpxH
VAAKRYAIVLSDVHIGDNTPTCWYQAAVHEPQLAAALAWIVAQRESVREVVLLGDLFDVWTYAPTVRPPSMRAIIAANPGLLGPAGPLAAVARAVPGEVRLLLGNHDGSLTSADIDELNRSLGAPIELIGPRRIVSGASGARTVFSHGHYHCMFNAPDVRSRWGTIPIGHFVSRAIAHQVARRLAPGRTAADLAGSGNPSGVDWTGVLSAWNRRDDLAAFLLQYIGRVTGLPSLHPIVMPDGSVTTLQDAGHVFAGLFSLWLRREGRLEDALRAANADRGSGKDLAFFAQRLAMQTGSDLAVMGHTHAAVAGVDVAPVDYVNSGFECVARPDAPRTPFTLTQVDLERGSAQVLAVVPRAGGSFSVVPASVPRMRSVIVHGRDYSCYARIENRGSQPLRLTRASKDSASHWVVPPPAFIAPHARLDVWVQDTVGLSGSAARFSYSDGTRGYDFALRCPTVLGNAVSSPVPFETKVSSGAWRRGSVNASGYPVQARFYVGAARPLVPIVTGPWRSRVPVP